MKQSQNKMITLPTETVKALATLANGERRPVKNYMEKILIDHAKSQKNGVERNTGVKKTGINTEA